MRSFSGCGILLEIIQSKYDTMPAIFCNGGFFIQKYLKYFVNLFDISIKVKQFGGVLCSGPLNLQHI